MKSNHPLTILQLDSSPSGSASVSRELTRSLATTLTARVPGARLVHRDLVADPVPHLDDAALVALGRSEAAAARKPAVETAAMLNETLVTEFLAADIVIIGAPMYNFSVPTQLKAWIDRIAQAGRTFRYTAAGPEGLAGDKTVVIVSSRGGYYAGQPGEAALDHQEAWLRAVLGFLGITDVTIVRAEGAALSEVIRASAVATALAEGRDVTNRIIASLVPTTGASDYAAAA